MPHVAYHSHFVSPFMEWFLNSTDAPAVFGEASAMMTLSTVALGRRWFTSSSPLHPNLYMMIVGPSSKARKTTTIERSMALIQQIAPSRKGPTDYTSEALFKFMEEKDETTGKGRTKLCLYGTEFAADLARSAAYRNTFRDDLTNLYDGFDIDKRRAGFGKSVYVASPRVSLFAAITYEGLSQHVTKLDWGTGFLQRFLYVAPTAQDWRETKANTPPEDPGRKEAALLALYEIVERIRFKGTDVSAYDGRMQFSPEAEEYYKESYTLHRDWIVSGKRTERELPAEVYTERFWPCVKKLALLNQIDLDPDDRIISYEALSRAIRFASQCWQGYIKAYRETTLRDFSTLCELLLEDLQKSGGKLPLASLSTAYGFNPQLPQVIKYMEMNDITHRQVVNGRSWIIAK
jgi:hypothetical protein